MHPIGEAAPRTREEATTLRAQRLTVAGVVVTVLLAVVKLAAGLIGHSYALVADAAESLTDVVASAVIWGGLHVSARPRTERHPYGYGKAESLAAAVVAAMLVVVGLTLAFAAVREIITPHHAPAAFTLVVLVLVVAVKEGMYRWLRRAAREMGSTVVETDAWHHRADALSSAAAFAGISIALLGGRGWEAADDWAALVASGLIVANGLRLSVQPVRELLDAQPERLVHEARAVAAGVAGVVHVEKVFARTSGTTHWVDMHVWVDGAMSVTEAHTVAHRVKQAIQSRLPAIGDVLIHIEPATAAERAAGQSGDVSS